MNKRTRREWEHRDALKQAGWDVPQQDMVAFNSGSETVEHFLCKAILAFQLKQQGFRVASEVEGPDGQVADLIAYGTEDPPVAVETETNLSDEVIQKKVGQYVNGQPMRDVLPIDVDQMPENIHEAREWAGGQL